MPELKEVQDKVRADVIAEKAFAKARAIAADLRARAQRDGLEKAAAALGLVRKQSDALVPRGQPLGDLGAERRGGDGGLSPFPWAACRSRCGRRRDGRSCACWRRRTTTPRPSRRKRRPSPPASTEERRGQLFQAYMQEARKRFPVLRRPDALRRVTS